MFVWRNPSPDIASDLRVPCLECSNAYFCCMNFSSKLLEDAVEALAMLPGVGRKTALRLALHLVRQDPDVADKIAGSITELRHKIRHCVHCNALSDQEMCDICSSSVRSNETICVVESDRDVMAIEDTQQFNGKYHVLGGLISPIDGVGPADLSIEMLLARIREHDVSEIIMALSPSIEGDTTIYYISRQLGDSRATISTIARGISFGGELEYADEVTLARSITGRLPYTLSD